MHLHPQERRKCVQKGAGKKKMKKMPTWDWIKKVLIFSIYKLVNTAHNIHTKPLFSLFLQKKNNNTEIDENATHMFVS